MIWNETIECMGREDMRKLQGIRLKRVVEHAYHNTPPIVTGKQIGRAHV